MIVKAFESQNERTRNIDIVQAKIHEINEPVSVDVELCLVPNIYSLISCQKIELAQTTHEL